jgi:hypothetical protein
MTAMSIAQLAGKKYMFYVGFGSWTQAGNYILATNPLLGMATYDANSDTWERDDDEPVPVNNTPSRRRRRGPSRRAWRRQCGWR